MPRRSPEKLKNGIYTKVWVDPTYTTTYTLVIVETLQDFREAYKQYTKEDDIETNDVAFTNSFVITDAFHVLIVLCTNADYGTMVHEAVHAQNLTLSHHGMKLDVDNDEHQAYHLQFIFNQIVDGFVGREALISKQKTKNAKKKAS